MNTDYERVQQEAVPVAAYLKALSRYLPGGTEKSHTKSNNLLFLERDLNPGPRKYEAAC